MYNIRVSCNLQLVVVVAAVGAPNPPKPPPNPVPPNAELACAGVDPNPPNVVLPAGVCPGKLKAGADDVEIVLNPPNAPAEVAAVAPKPIIFTVNKLQYMFYDFTIRL